MKTKEFSLISSSKTVIFTGEKPTICPICSMSTNPTLKNSACIPRGTKHIYLLEFQNECCENFIYCMYEAELSKKTSKLLSVFPTSLPKENIPENIKKFSPRFFEIYLQAQFSEFNNNFDLAAMGYRKSLEILVKDFAIKQLNKSLEEVSGKKLYTAIEEYLGDKESIATADVVRILGNDYSHYLQKYPEYDFLILKTYMEIFIKQIEMKLLIANPPVSRQ